jgi:Protein of unknown function (DUF2690)
VKSQFKRALVSLVVASSLGTGLLAVTPGVTLATSGYDGTNPAGTPCGDNSHAITNAAPGVLVRDPGSGLIVAQVDLRYSAYCGTVWTRVTNLTGRGAGYLSARDLSVFEENLHFGTCATLCNMSIQYYGGVDTLHQYGTFPYQGWGMQWSNPNPGSQWWAQSEGMVQYSGNINGASAQTAVVRLS